MKPDKLPAFHEGKEYRQLHPLKEGGGRWRFVTGKGIRLNLKGLTEDTILFHDKHGKVWAKLDRFGIYIAEGYAWNGCSPKRWVWPFGWMGTPDFEATRLASLVHDVLYQFACTEHFPLTREQVDALFYDIIAMQGEEDIASIYHGAVQKFASWDGRPKNGEYSTIETH